MNANCSIFRNMFFSVTIIVLFLSTNAYSLQSALTIPPEITNEIILERIILDFDGRKWITAHASASESEYLAEFRLEGESLRNWNELVSTMQFIIEPKPGLAEFMKDYYKKNIFKNCADANWNDIYKTENKIIASWDSEPCNGIDKTEYSLTAFVQSKAGGYTLIYVSKNKAVFEKNRDIWVEIFKNARTVLPKVSEKPLSSNLLTDKSKMVKIKYHHEYLDIDGKTHSFPSVDIWRSTSKHMRIEEQPDLDEGIHLLMIVDEPDSWQINLLSNKTAHEIDAGPTFNTKAPTFGQVKQDGCLSLELGRELEFFEFHRARKTGDELIDGVKCEVYELPRIRWVLKLYVRKDNKIPVMISRRGQDGTVSYVIYEEYQANLPFDSTLFVPPDNIEIVN